MAERSRSTRSGETAELTEGRAGAAAADAIGRVEAKVRDGDAQGAGREAAAGISDLKSAAVEGGRQFLDEARDRATTFADRRKDDAAQSVSDIAASLRETGKGFGERPNIQAFVGSAADGLEQLAAGIRDRSFAEIYGEVESYARRSPATVGAAAVLAGFVLARFIKASADDLSEASAASRSRAAKAAGGRDA